MGCGASKVVENERRPSGLHPCGDSSAASPTGRQEKLCPEAASQAILVANGSLQSPVVEEPAGAFNESTVMQRVSPHVQQLVNIDSCFTCRLVFYAVDSSPCSSSFVVLLLLAFGEAAWASRDAAPISLCSLPLACTNLVCSHP